MNIKRYFEQAEKLFKSQKYSQAIGPYTSLKPILIAWKHIMVEADLFLS